MPARSTHARRSSQNPGLYFDREITPCATAWLMPDSTEPVPSHLILGLNMPRRPPELGKSSCDGSLVFLDRHENPIPSSKITRSPAGSVTDEDD